MTKVTHILYLHGFRSSPFSYKSTYLARKFKLEYPEIYWLCPQLPPSPRAAIDLVVDYIKRWPKESTVVIGSSLGGFYARLLSRKFNMRAACINPATDPATDLQPYVGVLSCWHNKDVTFEFKASYIEELKLMYPETSMIVPMTPTTGTVTNNESPMTLLMSCTGDEQLSWHAMVKSYPDAKQYIVQGSDHAMSDFSDHCHVLFDFLGLK